MIRDKKTHQLLGVMETASRDGMITMERALKNLFEAGKITRETLIAMQPAGQDFLKM
jgi:twitching motility protein PilT